MVDIRNPIQTTSRTFNTILTDINTDSDLVDKPNWWKRIWAGVGDMLSVILNAAVNNLYLRTSFTRQAVKDELELIDYQLTPHSTSTGDCLFYVSTALGPAIFPFVVTKENLIARSEGSLSASSKLFGARADVNFTAVTEAIGVGDVNTGTDVITVAQDFEHTGHKVRFTTTGTLPAPLLIDTDYYIIYINATQIKLADTLEDAIAGNAIDLTTTGAAVQTMTLYSKAVVIYQQETLESTVNIGTSDGITEWQEFDLPDSLMLEDTLVITVNAVTWTKVDNFVESTSVSTHYKVIVKSENQFAIQFGNGTYGAIPGAFDINALYSFGGGIDSNVTVINGINSYTGNDSNITGASNPESITGGADEESIASAKKLGPLLLKARSRFVTVADGEALALAFGGLSLVKVNKNEFGVLSAQVVGIANGGGNPSASLKTALQTHLIDRTILESIDVRVQDATITSVNVTSAAKMLSGYVFADVLPFFTLAYQLFLSETGQEIKDQYDSTGISDTITLINTIFSTSFDDDDAAQIERLVDNLVPRDFGVDIQQSDVFGYIDTFVNGVDYITIAVFGGGFPLALADNEITTDGVLTLTEIP